MANFPTVEMILNGISYIKDLPKDLRISHDKMGSLVFSRDLEFLNGIDSDTDLTTGSVPSNRSTTLDSLLKREDNTDKEELLKKRVGKMLENLKTSVKEAEKEYSIEKEKDIEIRFNCASISETIEDARELYNFVMGK